MTEDLKAKAAPLDAIRQALDGLAPEDRCGWFLRDGYKAGDEHPEMRFIQSDNGLHVAAFDRLVEEARLRQAGLQRFIAACSPAAIDAILRLAAPVGEADSTVPWPVVDSYSGGADPAGLHSRVRLRLGDGPETVEYVPAAAAPDEMSPEFTDTARAALLWVLWNHQGRTSPVGQPLRYALGMGLAEPLSEHQVAEAKRWAVNMSSSTADFHRYAPVAPDVLAMERAALSAIIPGTHGRTFESFLPAESAGDMIDIALRAALSAQGEAKPDHIQAALDEERRKFQAETLRTSAMMTVLRKWVTRHEQEHGAGPWQRDCDLCALVGESQAVLGEAKPEPRARDRLYFGLQFSEAKKRILAMPVDDARELAISLLIRVGALEDRGFSVATPEPQEGRKPLTEEQIGAIVLPGKVRTQGDYACLVYAIRQAERLHGIGTQDGERDHG